MVGPNPVEREEIKGGKKRKREREKLYYFSRIPRDRTVGSCRSKWQSSYTRRGFHVGARIRGFHQTLRGRDFSYSVYFQLKSHLMAWVSSGSRVALMFSPKILGSKVEMLGTIQEVQNYLENWVTGPWIGGSRLGFLGHDRA